MAEISIGAFVSAALEGRADCTVVGVARRRWGVGALSTGRAEAEDSGGAFVMVLDAASGRMALGVVRGGGVGTTNAYGSRRSVVPFAISCDAVATGTAVVRAMSVTMIAPTNADEMDSAKASANHAERMGGRAADSSQNGIGPDLAILLLRAKPVIGSPASMNSAGRMGGGGRTTRSASSIG